MHKPKKKEVDKNYFCYSCNTPLRDPNCDYNQCWDDREAWLPSEGEILKLIIKTYNKKLKDSDLTPDFLEHFVRSGVIAKAISKRIRGEK